MGYGQNQRETGQCVNCTGPRDDSCRVFFFAIGSSANRKGQRSDSACTSGLPCSRSCSAVIARATGASRLGKVLPTVALYSLARPGGVRPRCPVPSPKRGSPQGSVVGKRAIVSFLCMRSITGRKFAISRRIQSCAKLLRSLCRNYKHPSELLYSGSKALCNESSWRLRGIRSFTGRISNP